MIHFDIIFYKSISGGSVVKNLTANAGDLCSIPGLEDPLDKEMATHSSILAWRIPCIPLFIAALFTIARTWKQPRCPSSDEWIKKLWYIYIMESYSAIKINAFESVPMRWMNLKPITQSEVSEKEKDKYSILMHIYRI